MFPKVLNFNSCKITDKRIIGMHWRFQSIDIELPFVPCQYKKMFTPPPGTGAGVAQTLFDAKF